MRKHASSRAAVKTRFSARARALVMASAIALTTASCGTGPGKDPGNTLGNLLAFNSPTAPPVANNGPATPSYDVVCPVVDVKEGGAAHRVYSGRGTGSSDVRYQYSIGQTARECSIVNGQLGIRIGVEGKVLLGPAGSASSFNVPVSIAIRDESSQQMLVSKTYQVAVTIPPGSPHATFSVVSEVLVVPYRRKEANEDYLIFVGFESAKAKPQRRRRVSRRR
ncbi:MAG: hypothetical protein NWT00_10900 [Beijerinckiaceae bacterium]|jgi:hypothetical protein|nr:hypothetical protein [Beijerinckiaceae bacterium]